MIYVMNKEIYTALKIIELGSDSFHKEIILIANHITQLKDQLHRRNMQIAELKKKVSEEANDLYNLMHTIREMDYAKQDNDTKRYDYWNNRLGQIIHIQPYGKIKD